VERAAVPGVNKNDGTKMKLVVEYLEQVRHFECIAAQEKNSRMKRELERQADAYRRLAADRAKKLEMPLPATGDAAAPMDEYA
jgi:hypothetical protein